jgi:5-oxoprolinase (ATP-hydrolysing) subunit A
VITDPRLATERAVQLVREGVVEASDGSVIQVRADTLCIHGDGRDPVGLAAAVRQALASAGIEMRPVFGRGADSQSA